MICRKIQISYLKNLFPNQPYPYQRFERKLQLGQLGKYKWRFTIDLKTVQRLLLKILKLQIQSLEKKYDKVDKNPIQEIFRLQPFDDIHFNQVYSTFGDRTAHKPTLYGLLDRR